MSSGGEIKKGRQPFVSVSAPCFNLCGRKCRISPNKHAHTKDECAPCRVPGEHAAEVPAYSVYPAD